MGVILERRTVAAAILKNRKGGGKFYSSVPPFCFCYYHYFLFFLRPSLSYSHPRQPPVRAGSLSACSKKGDEHNCTSIHYFLLHSHSHLQCTVHYGVYTVNTRKHNYRSPLSTTTHHSDFHTLHLTSSHLIAHLTHVAILVYAQSQG
mmetsp:Transcript_6920/g.17528  ORF Transcript_6920/g.17528 Transcript_6920/m.17528 type:complete len:147 (-) Transcript_6920:760-1200(-)